MMIESKYIKNYFHSDNEFGKKNIRLERIVPTYVQTKENIKFTYMYFNKSRN